MDTKNSCKAIISVGKRIGKICNRKNCSIAGHDRVNDGKGVCRQLLKFGRNRGEECGRKNCMFHPNIADFLEIPQIFRDTIIHYDYAKILYGISGYDVLNTIDEYPCKTRMLLAIYIIKLLDTPKMVSFRLTNKRFNSVVYYKINEFSNGPDYIFGSYFNRQFESNKRYLHKSKNRIVLLRNYVLARRCFISLYNSKKHRMVANAENITASYCNIL